MPVTFKVSDVKECKWPPESVPGSVTLVESIRDLSGVDVEASASNHGNLLGFYEDRWNGVQKMNGFLRAIHHSFATHAPLALSPDDVWVAIAQGFANHVNANAEKLQPLFLNKALPKGSKIYIEICRDSFIKGSPDNDWQGAFPEFSDRISEFIGDKRDLLVSNFSTTTLLTRASSEIVLMDAMQAYFSYGCKTCCGIPEITLEGTEDDWQSIIDRANRLSKFWCQPWIESLVKVLNHFAQAFKGNVDLKFWASLYKEGSGSGGPYVTGAVNVFYPYLRNYKTKAFTTPNEAALSWDQGIGCMCGGPTTDNVPLGFSSVPFTWNYYGKLYPMQFLGGFLGTSQDPETKIVRPALGWAVGPKPEGFDGSEEVEPRVARPTQVTKSEVLTPIKLQMTPINPVRHEILILGPDEPKDKP
jgi:hypothetical protein